MRRLGSFRLTPRRAAFIVAPVAIPSSTTIARRPWRSIGWGRSEIETPTTLDLSDLALLCRFEITTWRVNHFRHLLVDDQLR